jgi:hypothetical protein
MSCTEAYGRGGLITAGKVCCHAMGGVEKMAHNANASSKDARDDWRNCCISGRKRALSSQQPRRYIAHQDNADAWWRRWRLRMLRGLGASSLSMVREVSEGQLGQVMHPPSAAAAVTICPSLSQSLCHTIPVKSKILIRKGADRHRDFPGGGEEGGRACNRNNSVSTAVFWFSYKFVVFFKVRRVLFWASGCG